MSNTPNGCRLSAANFQNYNIKVYVVQANYNPGRLRGRQLLVYRSQLGLPTTNPIRPINSGVGVEPAPRLAPARLKCYTTL